MNGPAVRPGAWKAYWEGMHDRRIIAVEAGDYVRRLWVHRPLPGTARVLDFGCGFGHVADLLACRVAWVDAWDNASTMRAATMSRTRSRGNVRVVDLAPGACPPDELYDAILVNSVIQYMDRGELRQWLSRWRGMLHDLGVVVISDVPVPGNHMAGEIAHMAGEIAGVLRFASANGILGGALVDGVAEVWRYAKGRASQPLLQLTRDELESLVRPAGFSTTVLAPNLTHRQKRFTAVLRPA